MKIRSIAASVAAVAFAAGIFPAGMAFANDAVPKLPDVLPTKLVTELTGIFVVATVMESALSTLFNWRLYREFFDGRAFKTLVMIGFGYAVVKAFDYDVFYRIIGFAGGAGEKGILSGVLAALVLAGGSGAIYELFKSLGLRPPVEPAEAKPRPENNKAWASVRIVRAKAVGDVMIHFDMVEAPAEEQQKMPALAGIVGEKTFRERLKSVFFADRMRFPTCGGRTLDAGKVYEVAATGWRKSGNPKEPNVAFREKIYTGRFAGHAIVDFVHTI